MTRRALTLVEIAVVMLIFVLLVYGTINLLMVSSNRFTKLEHSTACAGEAARIMSLLHRDTEALIATKQGPILLANAENIARFDADILMFPASVASVSYQWVETDRSLIRMADGKKLQMGTGMIASFAAALHVLDRAGHEHIFPPPAGHANPASPDPLVVRAWLKVDMTLEMGKPKKGMVHQDYSFRLFPVRLNRSLQSIWCQRDW